MNYLVCNLQKIARSNVVQLTLSCKVAGGKLAEASGIPIIDWG